MQLKKLKIASRKSDLAKLQAYLVGASLKKSNPNFEIEYQFKESLGDKNLTDPLWKMPEKGVFTEDFYQDLLQGTSDMIVHSWKDLPVELKPETEIIATLKRADARDLLIFKRSSFEKLAQHSKIKIFSSSPRRSHNLIPFLSRYLPHGDQSVEFEPVRGNVPTRLRKMIENPNIDALIVAKAAIDRLLTTEISDFRETRQFLRESLALCHWMVLPLSANPTAAAQGALAVEILKSRTDLKDLLAPINSRADFEAVMSERNCLASHGGGCHQKIGITRLSRNFGELEFLRGLTEKNQILDSQKNLTEVPVKPWIEKSEDHFFRENLNFELPKNINALFVSHSQAWPENFNPEVQVLWTSGLSTWKKIAGLGFWVNGSSEGLGENEDPRLAALVSQDSLCWGKLAHSGAAGGDKTLLASYRLNKKPDRHFAIKHDVYYWKSASLFRSALELAPELIHKQHYCGPGHSFDEIKKICAHVKVLWPSPSERKDGL